MTTGNGTIDLADFDSTKAAAQGAVMEVRHPVTGDVIRHDDGRPYTITLLGRDSEKFQAKALAQSDRNIAVMRRTSQVPTARTTAQQGIELLVEATIKWDLVFNGRAAPSEPDEYRKAYTQLTWLREQVDDFVGTRGNFLKG